VRRSTRVSVMGIVSDKSEWVPFLVVIARIILAWRSGPQAARYKTVVTTVGPAGACPLPMHRCFRSHGMQLNGHSWSGLIGPSIPTWGPVRQR
jgi:hypothetical protein